MSNPKIKIEDLFELKTAVIYNPDSFSSSSLVSTDTRTIRKNSIFVAIKGEKFDGHDFVREAVANGASAVIINKDKLKKFDDVDVTIVTVKDTVHAYGELAGMWRKKLQSRVIAITGSNGKTTTKEMLAALLAEKYSVCRTLANNNNHIGVPLTILSANDKHDFLVLELGTNHFGEIAYTAAIAEPDLAVITNIGSSHLEFLKDHEGVATEKLALFEETLKSGGRIFLNKDDEILKSRAKNMKPAITFSFKSQADVKGKILSVSADGHPEIEITYNGKSAKINLPLCGMANAKNFLIAGAVALEAGMTLTELKKAASNLKSVDKRLNLKKFEKYAVVNDTYNANPESMKAAIEFIGQLKNYKKKIAVLGDMFELGKNAKQAHIDLAAALIKNKINEVYTMGTNMKHLNKTLAGGKITVRHFNKRNLLAEFLLKHDLKDAVVLIKGSRGMKMEEFINVLEARA